MHGSAHFQPDLGEYRVVLAHGCFDGLHLGHIRHLQEAKAQGDRLIVSVTDDPLVRKGMGRPRFTVRERIEALKALQCVDEVIVSMFPSAVEIIRAVRPEVYVKGCDYHDADDDRLAAEIAEVEAHGGKFFVTKADKLSSSRLINAERYGDAIAAYLRSCRERDFCTKIKAAIKRADELSIVYVGETILDEYIYVAALGKPSKEFMLATVEKRREQFLGGIAAAAAHCEWQRARYVSQSVPLVKTRYVDEDFSKKLFEVYSTQRLELADPQRVNFMCNVAAAVDAADVVVAMDFGHGLIEEIDRRTLQTAAFLAVNAQTNAGNVGFNPVTLYNKANMVCVDEPEARFAAGMPVEPIHSAMFWLMERVHTANVVVTRGRNGATICERHFEARPITIPAFTLQVTDTIGAGDAFLATAAPLVATGLELEAAAFAGNVAGAIKTTIVGHRSHVTRDQLLQNIEALLA